MQHAALSAVDVAVVVLYLAVVVGKGALLSRRQRTVRDYFLAGRRMSSWVVAISVIASLLSAITYMGAPTEAFVHDLRFSVMLFCIPLVAPVVIYLFLPFFYKLNLYTAYEYLEVRFSPAVRIVAAVFFILWRLGWMALVVFAPSLAISTFFNIPWQYCALIMGLASTAYTVMGGMTAVMWTDVVQFFVLYGGALIIIATAVARTDGGLEYLWAAAAANGKLRMFDWQWNPFERVTTWAILFGGTVGALAAYSTDQVAIQRYLTTKDFAASRRSLVIHAAVIVPVSIVFYLIGTVLWGFYHQHPELLAGFDRTHPDRILPFFIVQQLPVGIRGALIAALFAATMSSIDSGINSVTTSTVVDFYEGLLDRQYPPAAKLRLARAWTIAWGVVVTAAAIAAGTWGSTLVEMSNKVSGLFCGPLLGIFLLGLLSRKANWQGASIGAAVGFGASLVAAFGKGAAAYLPAGVLSDLVGSMGDVTFIYYPAIGCGLTFCAGLLASSAFPPPSARQTARPDEVAAWRKRPEDE